MTTERIIALARTIAHNAIDCDVPEHKLIERKELDALRKAFKAHDMVRNATADIRHDFVPLALR